ncbi:MAG: hypothetical protein AB7F19_07375 [Candidatus Babeliales bacterium]
MEKKLIIALALLCIAELAYSKDHTVPKLAPAPATIDQFHEIATRYNESLPDLYNSLTPEERVFMYYLFRAGLPGNRIIADQLHRHANAITQLCEHIYLHKNDPRVHVFAQHELFFEQLTTYLVYLWANHGQYFIREHANEKRSPARLGLTNLTHENFHQVLHALDEPKYVSLLQEVESSLFDHTHEHSVCVPNSIEQSAVNIYAPDFTEEDYNALSAQDRAHLNAYYSVTCQDGMRIPTVERYKIGGKYSDELTVACHWLEKACDYAHKHPHIFDEYIPESLTHLIEHVRTGCEDAFKRHCIAWTKTKSRLDYCFGFIENYCDPKEFRGMFQAEVTIKSIDMDSLNRILPSIESQLPFPAAWKRTNLHDLASIPNASINSLAVGSGELGPLSIVAAYCLPNYPEIRAQHGSKQIIYQSSKGLGTALNPVLAKQLSYLADEAEWRAIHDPEQQLSADIWNVHCILHETLGHGSGRLDMHTFRAGDPMTIDGVTHNIGDTIPVTNANLNEFFAGAGAALEELRAEILALYTSIYSFDELATADLFKEWPAKIGKEKLIDMLICDMANTALKRLQNLPDGATKVLGAHAQANTTIANWLQDHGGVTLQEEKKNINGTEYTVLGYVIKDRAKTLQLIKDLAIEVQRIHSTADGQSLQQLLDTYARNVRVPEHVSILKRNQQAIIGNLKVTAYIFPHFEPIFDAHGNVADINASWPENIVEQWLEYRELAMKTI